MANESTVLLPDYTGGLAYSQIPTTPLKTRYNLDGIGIQDTTDSVAFNQEVPVAAANKELAKYDYNGITPNTTPDKSWWDRVVESFNPNERGTSQGGQVMDALGTGAKIGTGLAGIYFAKKNFDLQKDDQNRRNAITNKAIAAGQQASRNAGNGASYNYNNVIGR